MHEELEQALTSNWSYEQKEFYEQLDDDDKRMVLLGMRFPPHLQEDNDQEEAKDTAVKEALEKIDDIRLEELGWNSMTAKTNEAPTKKRDTSEYTFVHQWDIDMDEQRQLLDQAGEDMEQ